MHQFWLSLGCLSLGALGMHLLFRLRKGGLAKLAQEVIERAESEAKRLQKESELQLKQAGIDHRQSLDKLTEEKMRKLATREEKLDRQLALIEKKTQDLEKKEKELARLHEKALEKQTELDFQNNQSLQLLQSLAQLSASEAKQLLFEQFTKEVQAECNAFLYKQKKEIESGAEHYAAEIITTAINRLALSTVSEAATLTVSVPNPEMKARVIGREGRNIRVLEQKTGVNFVIDDTPNAIVISGFDPVRKEIARIALKELIQDGRIHPTRIEEVVARTEEKVHTHIQKYGEEAAFKAGSFFFHPDLIQLLGKLHLRYSFGQNVLAHSLEVSHLMGMMADELKIDGARARRIGLLHDIGKAVSHEVEGSHALIGQQLALKYGESEEVANGIGCHHDEILPLTIEASLCSAADKISGGRLGARSESLEFYLKRSFKLENIARQFEGVEQAYALHAAKEVRVMIEPTRFDDAATLHLAREIAKKIEKELSYPGRIKVTVIREKRAVEYAS